MRQGFIRLLLAWSLISSSVSWADTADSAKEAEFSRDQTQLIEEEKTRELAEQEGIGKEAKPGQKSPWQVAYGGWVSSFFLHYVDLDNNKGKKEFLSSIWLQDLRFWYALSYQNTWFMYTRMKQSYTNRGVNSSTYTGVGDDYNGPHLDVGYLRLNLHRDYKIPFDVTVGRQYLTLGRGIAYSDISDGVQMRSEFGPASLKLIATRTLPTQDNIDYSVPGFDKGGERTFGGAELAIILSQDHVIYGYLLMQKDEGSENPEDPAIDYKYDSRYFGLGMSGHWPGTVMDYWGEVIRETGIAHADKVLDENVKAPVDAWAADVGFRLRPDWDLKPAFEGEWAYGSGESSRRNVTNTVDGVSYSNDENFLYFGDFFGGYALSPRLSNIHILKAGVSLKPFEWLSLLENVAVGGKYFLYRKDTAAGTISDTDANPGGTNADIGQEWNAYLYWKPVSSVFFSFRYGIFLPGEAYPLTANDNTHYFLTRVTVTF